MVPSLVEAPPRPSRPTTTPWNHGSRTPEDPVATKGPGKGRQVEEAARPLSLDSEKSRQRRPKNFLHRLQVGHARSQDLQAAFRKQASKGATAGRTQSDLICQTYIHSSSDYTMKKLFLDPI